MSAMHLRLIGVHVNKTTKSETERFLIKLNFSDGQGVTPSKIIMDLDTRTEADRIAKALTEKFIDGKLNMIPVYNARLEPDGYVNPKNKEKGAKILAAAPHEKIRIAFDEAYAPAPHVEVTGLDGII
jgi:hypothetical protein